MTEPLPSFVHNLGKTLDEMLEVSGVLRQDIESLVAAYRHDWFSRRYDACLCVPSGR